MSTNDCPLVPSLTSKKLIEDVNNLMVHVDELLRTKESRDLDDMTA